MKLADLTSSGLQVMVEEAHQRTKSLVEDLDEEQWVGPRVPIVNPFHWEVGHVGWFWERWILRHLAESRPMHPGADAYYNSAEVAHDTRWDLHLPSRLRTLEYTDRVAELILERLAVREPREHERFFYLLALYHEDMHTEAFTYMRQSLGYPEPPFCRQARERGSRVPGDRSQGATSLGARSLGDRSLGDRSLGDRSLGDWACRGGTFEIGAKDDGWFVHDNEKWAHPKDVGPFHISRVPVSSGEFADFVDDGGYDRREHWGDEGWAWRQAERASAPVYWRHDGRVWLERRFDQWEPLDRSLPVCHVNWFEADAYCRWAGRRLPTEAEWEVAASYGQGSQGCSRFPWGDDRPTESRANLDWQHGGRIPIGSLPESRSAGGCEQMIGDVWEWTSSDFLPYPGFEPDPYKEYSKPWFGDHRVLRGGAWPTRGRLIRNTWRNFYTPDRRDPWVGFRTCAR